MDRKTLMGVEIENSGTRSVEGKEISRQEIEGDGTRSQTSLMQLEYN